MMSVIMTTMAMVIMTVMTTARLPTTPISLIVTVTSIIPLFSPRLSPLVAMPAIWMTTTMAKTMISIIAPASTTILIWIMMVFQMVVTRSLIKILI